MRYKLVKAQDNIVWVPIQPLMQDVMEALDNAKKIDTSSMDDNEKRGVDFTILTMEGVYSFLGSLLTEQTLNDAKEKLNDQQTNTKDNN